MRAVGRVLDAGYPDCSQRGPILGGHLAALFGAATAAFGATKTMVVAHLLTLHRAPFANFGADATILRRKAAFASQGADAEMADLDTFATASGTIAAFHFVHFHHLAKTVLTIDEALLTNFDTTLMGRCDSHRYILLNFIVNN